MTDFISTRWLEESYENSSKYARNHEPAISLSVAQPCLKDLQGEPIGSSLGILLGDSSGILMGLGRKEEAWPETNLRSQGIVFGAVTLPAVSVSKLIQLPRVLSQPCYIFITNEVIVFEDNMFLLLMHSKVVI
ncbi:hypothetical protein L2E82_44874 [Cichorium intybus]|uniref:Uncharacterized protein n=1 Tax=Cichorium intybus TaxID=13427 RepID=A0ACB8ZRM6_CICIN|nr:hypothetical protein L2E82_44874 [Cichorium intybus]